MSNATKIRPKERDAIIQSLRAGVVPRIGQQHVQVGRVREIEALINDINRIIDGGSGIRLIIGDYGSGKSFFLSLVRTVALHKKLVTAHADLDPNRRLHGTGGQARSLFAELMRNMSTRTKPEGNALASVVERFVSSALGEAKANGTNPGVVIAERLEKLSEMVGGYDFADVIGAYWRGHDTGNDQLKADAVRWLRGEFTTKTDARAALGVRTFVDDAGFYDYLKLMARFVKLAGYDGLLVCLDEMVNLYKLSHTQSRNANYEQILRILNDCLQGSTEGLGFLMGGTPEFLTDTRRGLFSYEALQSRLAENSFAKNGLVDMSGPVIRLTTLSKEETFVLLQKLRIVVASADSGRELISDQGIQAFMDYCYNKVGASHFATPRNFAKYFLDLLVILLQHPDQRWENHLGGLEFKADIDPSTLLGMEDEGDEDDELTSFTL
ncbi:MAG: ATP-binding protein [Desulfobulbaceae bacterium]|nr:ATP-binding protein [Desulfobulbaceae bacterium]